MEFTLFFDGDLPPRAGAKKKWDIRREFEPQIRKLWATPPVSNMQKYTDPKYNPNDSYVGKKIAGLEYIPLICGTLSLRCELKIRLLSASMPGGLLNASDLDNRMKTLLDALSIPQKQQIPDKADVETDNRVFCLLEDDKYIIRLDISNDRLLTENDHSRRTVAIIRVKPTAFETRMSNIDIVT